jgi:hypothetical protein
VDIPLTAEAPDGSWEARLGKAPPIYSREINYWLFSAALEILRGRRDIGRESRPCRERGMCQPFKRRSRLFFRACRLLGRKTTS